MYDSFGLLPLLSLFPALAHGAYNVLHKHTRFVALESTTKKKKSGSIGRTQTTDVAYVPPIGCYVSS